MTWSAGTRVGPYEILGPLGEGGMGQVWKARDTRLGRSVAVKQLTSRHIDRFEQEARAIAALNHPHICQIYDIGPDYLVLEYIDGRAIHGPLPPQEAVRLAMQIAGAMEAAHARGILHRDLKPANMMITASGEVKILDFGLAKVTSAAADVTTTAEGTVVGTVSYMSPEQAEGRAVDARSDVFSFGAVFYEMLSGRRAFHGDTTVQVLTAVLRQDPAPLSAPPGIDRIVRRCLEKRPERRFQTMAELRTALETLARDSSSVPVSERRPSIAVLPFADMSAAKDQEWFGDGLAEEIINALTHIPGLKVIARTSAFAFKGQNVDIRRVAEALGVGHILEGSVRTSGDRLRVTAQLITAADGSHLWSERYDRKMTDVFAIQDEIARAIATALRVELSAPPTSLRRHTPSVPAYEAYLKGFFHFRKRTPEGWTRAKECFDEARALDPEFALAHASTAMYYFALAIFSVLPVSNAIPLAKTHAQKALELDQSLPEAHATLAAIAATYEYDWINAQRRYELALAGEVSSMVRAQLGLVSLLMGRAEAAVLEFDRALSDDPLNMENREYRGFSLAAAGKLIEGCEDLQRVVELDENRWFAQAHLSTLFALRGMLGEALAAAEKAHALAPWDAPTVGIVAGVLARAGKRERSDRLLRQLETLPEYRTPLGFLCFHTLCDEIDQASDWAEKAIQQRHPVTLFFLRGPLAIALRASSRWPTLARMMNLPSTSS